MFKEQILTSDANDGRQSEEGEIILVQQKIGEKVFSGERPIKFPSVVDNVFHMILLDMRGFLGMVDGDEADYREIAYGHEGLKPHERWKAHYWNNAPIKGIFERENPLRAAYTVQERIHFLGFVNEQEYCEGCLLKQIYYYHNPLLFNDHLHAQSIIDKLPFRRDRIYTLPPSEGMEGLSGI